MNAKEFAHELEKCASFIRQQQIEIEALKSRELTDEEIMYLAKRFEGVWDGAIDYKGFAKAILKKAQEK